MKFWHLIPLLTLSCTSQIQTEQESSQRSVANNGQRSSAQASAEVSGSVTGLPATSFGLMSNPQQIPLPMAAVKIFEIVDGVSKAIATTQADDQGNFSAFLEDVTDGKILLAVAYKDGVASGQRLVRVTLSSLSLTADKDVKKNIRIDASISLETTIAASLLIKTKGDDLGSLTASQLDEVQTLVKSHLEKEGLPKNVGGLSAITNAVIANDDFNNKLVASSVAGLLKNSAPSNIISALDKIRGAEPVLKSVLVEASSLQIAKGSAATLAAFGLYSDGSKKDLTKVAVFTSDSPKCAVERAASGIVTAKAFDVGSAQIKAAVGSVESSLVLTLAPAKIISLALSPQNQTVAKNMTLQFQAIATYSDGTTLDVTSSVQWTSLTPSIASISSSGQKGLATGVAAGAATFKASRDGVEEQVGLTVSAASLSSIQITPATPQAAKGLTADLVATGLYSDGSTQNITSSVAWTSSDTSKATVSNSVGQSGRVTGVDVGSATITATLSGKTASQTFSVTNATVISLNLTPSSLSLAKGLTTVLTANAVYSDSSNQTLAGNASTWSSSNTAVATVSNGTVTAVQLGTATITASFGGQQTSVSVSVTAATLSSISVSPSSSTKALGLQQQFTATGTYSDGSTQDITSSTTWTSSDTSKATVSNAGGSNGLASSVASGSSTVTATLSGISGTANFTITAASLVSIAITPATPSVAKGVSQQFTATGSYSDSSTQDITTSVTWGSSNTSVATISNAGGSQGQASTLATGTTTISATLGGVSAPTRTLTVTTETLVSIAVTPANPSSAKGLTRQFTATGTYTDSSTQNLTTQATWQSANTSVATISNVGGSEGLATSINTGSTTISATFSGVTGQTTFTVTSPTLVSIAVTPTNPSVAKGLTQQFTATGTYTDATTQNLSSTATWSSSDTSKATVDSSGLATSVATGSSIITASLSGVSGNTTLTVSAPALQSIAITPATPSIVYASTQQFAATGTYTDSSTQNLTGSANWSSSDTSKVTINSSGLASTAGIGASSITASQSSITSNSATLTVTAQAAPNDPTGLSVTVDSSTQITLSWASGGGTTSSYKIAYQSGATAPTDCSSGTITTSTTTSKAITGLSASTQYSFRVCSMNGNPTPNLSSGIITSGTTSGSCGGTVVGGYCWYLADSNPSPTSCATTCASHGGYNSATETYAGSGGSNANCNAVIAALFNIATYCSSYGSPWTTTGPGAGCYADDANGGCLRDLTTTTAAAVPAGFYKPRACACNN